jgi:KDO2-lipid IV(A) lauroyltransferase
LLKRVKIDSSLTQKYYRLGYPVFGMTSHFCNWEWLLVSSTNQLGLPLHAVYQRLRNPFFNNLVLKIRSRFGVILHEKDDAVKDLIGMKGQSYLMSMVADQRPFSGENKYWTKFLNQDATFYTGTELLARRMDIKVIYAAMKRVRKGYYEVHYEVHFEKLELNPTTTSPGEITEKYIEKAERDICHDPSSYLWSHDRWKHKKPTK